METTADVRAAGNSQSISILNLAALFGNEFSIDWIQDLSGERASNVLTTMEDGVRQGTLKQVRLGVYAFMHPQEQAEYLSSFSEGEKAKLHRQAVDLIRREFPDNKDMLPLLAHHLMNTANDLDDCRILCEAGEALYRTYRQRDALQCYARVISNLGPVKGTEADQLFVDAVNMYARIYNFTDDPRDPIAKIKEAIVRAEGTGHPFRALLKMHQAKFEWYRGRQATAIRLFNEGWSVAQSAENPTTKRYAMTLRLFFFGRQGRYRDVVQAYEESAEPVNRFPRGKFPNRAIRLLGESLVLCGRVPEGIGMLDGLRETCREIGDTDSLAGVMVSQAYVFRQIGRVKEAIQILKEAKDLPSEKLDADTRYHFLCGYAEAFALEGDYETAVAHIREAMPISYLGEVDLLVHRDACNQICAAMEEDELLRLCGLTSEQIVQSALKSRNVLVRGMGYLFRARRHMKEGRPAKEILRALMLSVKWLEASGNELQLAKTRLELARIHLTTGDQASAKEVMQKVYKILAPIDQSLIPEDLAPLITDRSVKRDFLKEISALGQEIMTIRDNRELVLRILSAINQLTGAERGAIFLVADAGQSPGIRLEAARNLTEEHVGRPGFSSSMEIIRQTIASSNGRIVKLDAQDGIRSCFCVPMVLTGNVVGALYHDSHYFDCSVEEDDLDVLTFLAGEAAIALDNARAYERIRQLNRQLMDEKQYYEEKDLSQFQFRNFVGKSPAMQRVFGQIRQVAAQDTIVLIQGETGVGKELVARTIQRESHRKDNPFISADCSAFSETLIASELFGHEKGAFTGAQSRRIGRFELAHRGTLFLDEIGNIPMGVQVRLLRVLQTKEFQRVGGMQTIHSNFRLISATNKDLSEEVAAGRFREDLFYRLNVFPITIPPLRERKEDIPTLALLFLRSYSKRMGKLFDSIPKTEMKKLIEYPWLGNVREMQNVIERGVLSSSGSRFRVPELPGNRYHAPEKEMITLAENERRHILWVLGKTGGKISGESSASQFLGIPHSTLYYRMKKLGIEL